MLDEPLGALDRTLRQRLMMDLIKILRQVNITTVFVTHDQGEAFAMSDTIVVMDSGCIEQIASPEMLYKHPENVRVARFLGFENLLQAQVIGTNKVETPLCVLEMDTQHHALGDMVTVLIRPENATLVDRSEDIGEDNFLVQGRIIDCIFLGRCYHLHLETGRGYRLCFDLPNHIPPLMSSASAKLAVKNSSATIINSG
jgi:ABC-type Fe3+/spermidine/putrescine transport system ATPase subunit